ncbi:hypothetical protein Gotur_017418, partial [Gossypium turneri]
IPSAFAAEALPCVQAIRFRVKLGFLRSDIEGDALSVIKKIQSEEDERSEIRAYILDAKRLKSYFISCRFRHAWRQMNKVAHLLAKEGLNMEEDTYLRNDLPRSVARAIEENRRDGRMCFDDWGKGELDSEDILVQLAQTSEQLISNLSGNEMQKMEEEEEEEERDSSMKDDWLLIDF